MNGFTLLVPGEPIAKGRPRVYNGHGVTPKRTRNAENRIYAEFRLKYPDAEPLQGSSASIWSSGSRSAASPTATTCTSS